MRQLQRRHVRGRRGRSAAAGTWTLRVTDTRAWNFGSLSGWSITL